MNADKPSTQASPAMVLQKTLAGERATSVHNAIMVVAEAYGRMLGDLVLESGIQRAEIAAKSAFLDAARGEAAMLKKTVEDLREKLAKAEALIPKDLEPPRRG
jgi:hypothetical protein